MSSRELEFVESLGEGGFGMVYLANLHGRDQFVRRVAVKVMRVTGEELGDRLARQRDEARLLGLLHHDHIVQVLDLTEVDGRPAVVMEYVEGADLAEVLRVTAPGRGIGARAALEVVAATASALDAAWGAVSAHTGRPLRVVHRDIKPANILVTPNGGVKVLDFGVARADFARESYTGSNAFGTPRFMAPEVWMGSEPTPAVDVYALGVTLLELLGGTMDRPPLQPLSRYTDHIDSAIARLAYPQFADLISRCLDYEPDRRPTAAELIEEVGQMLGAATGDPLSRVARRVIPGLVEKRRQKAGQNDLPSRASLDTGAVSEIGAVATLGVPQSPSVVSAEQSLKVPVAVGAVALIALFAGAFGLAVMAWWFTGASSNATVDGAAAPTLDAATPPGPITADGSVTPPTPGSETGTTGAGTTSPQGPRTPGTTGAGTTGAGTSPDPTPGATTEETTDAGAHQAGAAPPSKGAIDAASGTGESSKTPTNKTPTTTPATTKTTTAASPKPPATPEATPPAAPAAEPPAVALPVPQTARFTLNLPLTGCTTTLDGSPIKDPYRGMELALGIHTLVVSGAEHGVSCSLNLKSDVSWDWAKHSKCVPPSLPSGCRSLR